ncbi:MAG: hypothetical protein NTX73_15590 [Rhodobacterales bacterium]|nr:hypothetical protein [Rhodobacterales bacterium]
MSRIRQIAVATGTFSVALGIGFVMQNGDALAARFGGDPIAAQTASATAPLPGEMLQPGTAASIEQERPDPTHTLTAPVVVAAQTPVEIVAAPVSVADNVDPPAFAAPDLSAPQPMAVGDASATAPETTPVLEAAVDPADKAAPGSTLITPDLTETQPITVAATEAPSTAPENAPALQAAIDPAELVSQTPSFDDPAAGTAPAVTEDPVPDAPIVQAALNPTDATPTLPDAPILADPVCEPTLMATAMPAAMVQLDLLAPCAPDARVTIHHQGMMFSVLTNASGMVSLSVPALSENAVFMADVGADQGAVAIVTVPDLGTYDRAVLQWQGLDGPEIHALEFGASYADEGHVWHGASRNPDAALAGTGGFLVRLGDGQGMNPLMAEVYSYPSGQSRMSGTVAFSVETPVTADNCGSNLLAQTIQLSPGAEPFALDLDMAVPACDAVGQYLVLKNLLLDLTLAAK